MKIEETVGNRYLALGMDPAWAEIGIHYEDPYCWLVRDAVLLPGGREVVHHRVLWKSGPISGVVMLPRLKGQFILVRHYRHPIGEWSWECPRGGTTLGETLEETLAKELQEEIGARTFGIHRLGHMDPVNSLIDSGVDLFLVDVASIGEPETEEGIAEIRLVTAEELTAMVSGGEITDASTISAVAQAAFQGFLDEGNDPRN